MRPGVDLRLLAAASAALLFAAVAGATAPDGAAAPRAQGVAIPVADGHVSSASPRRNYGRARALRIGASPAQRAFLRFRFDPQEEATLSGATIRVWVHRSARGGRVHVRRLRSDGWSERTLTSRNAPTLGARSGTSFVGPRGGWLNIGLKSFADRDGVLSVALTSSSPLLRIASREAGARAPKLVFRTAEVAHPVIAAAGNIACDPLSPGYNGGAGTATDCRQRATSDLLVNAGLAAVLPLGDLQYQCGGFSAFSQVFNPTWGRVKAITRPTIGNHEYRAGPLPGTDCTEGQPSGYVRYFGAAAGPPGQHWYSYDIGSWHLISLNTNCEYLTGGCGIGSPQEQWLREDLRTHRNRCTLATFHNPRFSSSYSSGDREAAAFVEQLYAAGADVVLTAHDHVYERFAPLDAAGQVDAAKGIRHFTVGTGGFSHHPFFTTATGSEVRNNTTFGVLKLTLRPKSYGWQFVPEAGATFTDSGSSRCH